MTAARRWLSLGLCLTITSACSHVVMIKTTPPGAIVRIDGEVKGVTPLMFEEATGFGRRYELELELDGYQGEKLSLQQEEWWHTCFWPSLCLMPFTLGVSGVGILFSRSLRDDYHYMLRRLPEPQTVEKAAGAIPVPVGGAQPDAPGRADTQPASAPSSNPDAPATEAAEPTTESVLEH